MNSTDCDGGYFTPRVLLMRVPEQMTEGEGKVKTFIIKDNSRVGIKRFTSNFRIDE